MATKPQHDYHLVNPSPWPIIGAFAALTMAAGAVGWMHKLTFGPWVFFLGLTAVLFTFYSWWSDVVHEANTGDHTPVVQLHHRYGMILFIASEVMFFVAWFWALFQLVALPEHGRDRRRCLAAEGRRGARPVRLPAAQHG